MTWTKAVHGDVSALSPGGVRVGAPVRDPGVFFGTFTSLDIQVYLLRLGTWTPPNMYIYILKYNIYI